MTSSRTYIFIVVIAVILVAGIIFFMGKPPAPSPVQNTSGSTCPGQECRPNTTLPTGNTLSPAETKLSTDLLQLAGSRELPGGMTRADLELRMEQNHQLTHAGTGETLVYVYIATNDADPTPINTLVWNVTDSDPANHLVVAWVDVGKLVNLASLDSVRSIRTIMPPVTRKSD